MPCEHGENAGDSEAFVTLLGVPDAARAPRARGISARAVVVAERRYFSNSSIATVHT